MQHEHAPVVVHEVVVVVVVGNVCRWCSWVAVVIDVDGEQTLCALLLRKRSTLLLWFISALLLCSR